MTAMMLNNTDCPIVNMYRVEQQSIINYLCGSVGADWMKMKFIGLLYFHVVCQKSAEQAAILDFFMFSTPMISLPCK